MPQGAPSSEFYIYINELNLKGYSIECDAASGVNVRRGIHPFLCTMISGTKNWFTAIIIKK